MITIGIDPGKSGCLCVLTNNTPTFFDWPKPEERQRCWRCWLEWAAQEAEEKE